MIVMNISALNASSTLIDEYHNAFVLSQQQCPSFMIYKMNIMMHLYCLIKCPSFMMHTDEYHDAFVLSHEVPQFHDEHR